MNFQVTLKSINSTKIYLYAQVNVVFCLLKNGELLLASQILGNKMVRLYCIGKDYFACGSHPPICPLE